MPEAAACGLAAALRSSTPANRSTRYCKRRAGREQQVPTRRGQSLQSWCFAALHVCVTCMQCRGMVLCGAAGGECARNARAVRGGCRMHIHITLALRTLHKTVPQSPAVAHGNTYLGALWLNIEYTVNGNTQNTSKQSLPPLWNMRLESCRCAMHATEMGRNRKDAYMHMHMQRYARRWRIPTIIAYRPSSLCCLYTWRQICARHDNKETSSRPACKQEIREMCVSESSSA
eukprot:1155346-Pelagomonas_calceolata.AAC.3